MEYLIILLVVALAAAPLLHFAPSRRQRRLARLREHAALSGLFVEFRKLPGDLAERHPGTNGKTIYYGYRLPPPRHGESRSGAWSSVDGTWRALGDRGSPVSPVPASLADLPASVLAASVDNGSCGVYWLEAGEEQEIDTITAVLKAWAAIL